MFTVFGTFAAIAAGVEARPFVCVPPSPGRAYLPDGAEITYAAALARVIQLQSVYRAAGFGHGHRMAMLLENRPDFLLHFLALNGLGTSIVPLNPDLRHAEPSSVFARRFAARNPALLGRNKIPTIQ